VCLWEREGQKASGRRDAAEQASNCNSTFYPAYHLQDEGNGTGTFANTTNNPGDAHSHVTNPPGTLPGSPPEPGGEREWHFKRVLCPTLTAACSRAAAPSLCQGLAGSACGVLYSRVSVFCALSSFINFKQNGGDVNSPLGICQCLLNMLYIPLLILY